MKRSHLLFLAAASAAILFPCAVDDSPRFVPHFHPEQVNSRFLQGQLGLLGPTLSDRYLVIAWRYLSGHPLTPEEQAALAKPHTDRLDPAMVQWEQTAHPKMLIVMKVSRVAQNAFYLNCLPDAFATANATLADRRKTYGSDALVQGWLAAQNQVFNNCYNRAPDYPSEPDASLPPLAREDRVYQIAAAHFYAEDFDGARQRFEAISKDAASPWRATAGYMMARVLLREETLLKRTALAPELHARLLQVASDPNAGRFQNAARQLTGYADSFTEPQAVAASIAKQVSGPDFSAAVDLAAYALTAERFKTAVAAPDAPEPFNWVESMDNARPGYALQQWKGARSELWLVPAILTADGKSPDAPALIEAAKAVSAASPAWATVTHSAVRLMIESGQEPAARDMLDRLLSGPPRELVSVDNAFRAQRMSVATSFDDFLRWAARKPIGMVDEGYEPSDAPVDQSPVLGDDSLAVINRLPLARLVTAAESNRLPAWSAADIALIGFARALALRDDETAARLEPILLNARPKWAADLSAWLNATGDAKRFAADVLIERHAELRIELFSEFRTLPYVEPGDDQWWCAPRAADDEKPNPLETRILTEAEREAAARQRKALIDDGPAQAVIAPSVMAWAAAHPDDARVPESLYRLVRMTRYGCRGIPEINGPISKAAFDLLHGKYPDNTYTKQTPYWYKD
jgi:hypothetical protein